MNRKKPFRSPAVSITAGAVFLLTLAGPLAAGDDTQINDLIGGDGSAAQSANPSTRTPATTAPPKQEKSDETASGDAWVKSVNALDHVQLLAGKPLPGETCKNVIFGARPSIKTRHDLRHGKKVTLTLTRTCLIGFRNDTEDKTVVVRLGEAFETIAIVLDPRLFTGYAIAPGQQIIVPLRRLPVKTMDVSLEAAWETDLEKSDPPIGRTTLSLIQGK